MTSKTTHKAYSYITTRNSHLPPTLHEIIKAGSDLRGSVHLRIVWSKHIRSYEALRDVMDLNEYANGRVQLCQLRLTEYDLGSPPEY